MASPGGIAISHPHSLVLLKIVGKPLWWILLMFVPLVNLIISIS